MDYNIFSNIAPAMPKPSKGTEFVKFAISQASKDMQEVLIPMAIPALAAHFTDVRFMYSDNKYYEMCGQMGHLKGANKEKTEHTDMRFRFSTLSTVLILYSSGTAMANELWACEAYLQSSGV